MQEHGADLTATNNEGQTAMSLAVGVGNKNGKFTFIDFKWLSFWVALNWFKTKVTRKLWANLLRDLWTVIQGGKNNSESFRFRVSKDLLSYGPVAWTKLGVEIYINICISWTLHKKKKFIGCFSVRSRAIIVLLWLLVRCNIRWLLHLSPSLFSVSGARKEKKIKSSAREREKKRSRIFYDNTDKVENDCDSADWPNCALKSRKDNAA